MKADGTTMMQSDVTYPVESFKIDGVHYFAIDGSHRYRALRDVSLLAAKGHDDLAAHWMGVAMGAHGCAIRDTETTLGKGCK